MKVTLNLGDQKVNIQPTVNGFSLMKGKMHVELNFTDIATLVKFKELIDRLLADQLVRICRIAKKL